MNRGHSKTRPTTVVANPMAVTVAAVTLEANTIVSEGRSTAGRLSSEFTSRSAAVTASQSSRVIAVSSTPATTRDSGMFSVAHCTPGNPPTWRSTASPRSHPASSSDRVRTSIQQLLRPRQLRRDGGAPTNSATTSVTAATIPVGKAVTAPIGSVTSPAPAVTARAAARTPVSRARSGNVAEVRSSEVRSTKATCRQVCADPTSTTCVASVTRSPWLRRLRTCDGWSRRVPPS